MMVVVSKIENEITTRRDALSLSKRPRSLSTMTSVLPGESVPAQHVNLKLGPGLLQESSVNKENIIISTRAGDLKHSDNNKRWWIESNSLRVRFRNISEIPI